jgi:hypothetical protein
MIAYDKTLLENVFIKDEASRLKESGFISREQYQATFHQLPTLKVQKNIFIRIGLFILGSFMYSSSCGTISIFTFSIVHDSFLFLTYLFALIGFGSKEFMSTKMNYFGYGLDDAFILGAIASLLFAVGYTITQQNYELNFLLLFIVLTIVSSICYLRYLNLSLALLACIGFSGSLAYLMFELGTIGKSILPFVMMLFSGMLYFLSKKRIENLKSPYYLKGIQLANSFSLMLFYLSGNYLVVRELSILLLKKDIPATQEIPFALFFYAFTLIVPVCYLIYSLKKREKPMLWLGFLAIGFSIYTIRYYHHILPPEVALTFGGLALFAFTYFSIKKIKTNETGITFLPNRFSDSNSQLNLEIVIVASQFGLKPEIKPEDSPMGFGGGGFSGGGSSGEF